MQEFFTKYITIMLLLHEQFFVEKLRKTYFHAPAIYTLNNKHL